MPCPATHVTSQTQETTSQSMTSTLKKPHLYHRLEHLTKTLGSQKIYTFRSCEDTQTTTQSIKASKIIQTGFPNKRNLLPKSMEKCWAIKHHLSIDDDLIVYGCRLFVPISLCTTMLSRLHEAHQGIARSQARARLTIYWPNIDQDIKHFVDGCRHCQDRLPPHAKEPLIAKPTPDRPFFSNWQWTLHHMGATSSSSW